MPAEGLDSISAFAGNDQPVASNWGWADGYDPNRFLMNRLAWETTNPTGQIPGTAPIGSPQPVAGPRLSPGIAKVLQDTIGFVQGQAANPGGTSIIANPRSQTQAGNVRGLQSAYDTAKPVKQQSLTDFTREFLATKPKASQAYNQENSAINRIYSTGPGSLQYDLDRNLRGRDAGVNMAAQRAIQQAKLQNNLARMGAGNNSYLDRAYADAVARIMADQAISSSDLERENLLTTTGLQTQNLGRRGDLRRAYLQDTLMPYDQTNRLALNDADVVRGLGEMERSNNYYDYLGPEEQVNQRMGLLDSLMELDQMQQEYGLT